MARCSPAFPWANPLKGHMLELHFPSAAASPGLMLLQRRSLRECASRTLSARRGLEMHFRGGGGGAHSSICSAARTRRPPCPPAAPHITRSTATPDERIEIFRWRINGGGPCDVWSRAMWTLWTHSCALTIPACYTLMGICSQTERQRIRLRILKQPRSFSAALRYIVCTV